jgi:PAS domain S-box-containing protein
MTLNLTAIFSTIFLSCLALHLGARRMKKELARRAEADEYARLLLASVGEGVLGVNDQGIVDFVNKSALELLGYDADGELLGRDAREMLHHAYADCPRCPREKCLILPVFSTGCPQHSENELLSRKDRSIFSADFNCTPIWSGTKLRGAVMTFRDGSERRETRERLRLQEAALEAAANSVMIEVTERKRAEEALLRSNQALEEVNRQLGQAIERANELALKAERANASKNQFLANMSHEIRTPMNAIVGVCQLLQDAQLPAPQDEYLKMLLVSAEGLFGIINDILDFSKIEAGKLDLNTVDFDPEQVIREVMAGCAVSAEAKGLELRLELERGVPGRLAGDPQRLAQILNNLLSNAVKFTRSGSVCLSVTATRQSAEGADLEFSVRDTGMGIRAEDQARLFQAFTQVDGSMTRTFGGTGLGLAICRRLATLMGGEIWCESSPGVGSTFSFRLPFALAKGGAAAPAECTASVAKAPFNGQRILLVEDNLFNQQVAVALLKMGGLQVTLAVNGLEAVELIGREEFDLVLMDIQMPVMDGLTAARQIRKLARPGVATLPILAVSANAMAEDVKESLAAGMNAHIAKPYTLDSLYAPIAFWLGVKGGQTCAPGRGRRPGDEDEAGLRQTERAIDFQTGIRQIGGDRALYRDLLGRFAAEYGEKGEELRREVESGNLQHAARLAHSLTGVAGVLAALPLQSAAKRLEAALKSGDRGVELLVARFQGELAAALASVREELSPRPAGSGDKSD